MSSSARTMPRVAKTATHQQRSTGGLFAPSHPTLADSGTEEDDGDGDIEWESDTESDTEDPDYSELWDAQPKPWTYDECEQRQREKREKAAAKLHAAEMRSAENREGGALNKNAGMGAYGVGGVAKRTVQKKKKTLRDTFNAGTLNISKDELDRQLAAIEATEAPSARKPIPAASGSQPTQQTLHTMFAQQKRVRAPSPDDGLQEIIMPSFKHLRTDQPDPPAVELSSEESGNEEEEEEPEPEQVEAQAREEQGDAVVDAAILVDDIAGWVDTILDDATPQEPKELGALAAACLKVARRKKDYASEVLFTSLVNFYRWMPRLGRLRAAV
ncbi:hypothetical protein C8F04DRAFT_1281500 [Mycena alexandri]|uniref:Uncharacterized protein n=1 Tax=Mycena alexandri TaxID=1745969 RepID=A0AAD6RXM2_9AGAR|nr:hypothetical protein C8F04DRAFT_1281500 [Mycena alexandri]